MTRTLPVDGGLLDGVLLHLRRDSGAASLRWTLGSRGAAEVDTGFVRAATGWTTTVRLWNPNGLAVTAATLQCSAALADAVRLTLEPTVPAAPAWGRDGCELEELARVALDEFAEELLWHASRSGIAQHG